MGSDYPDGYFTFGELSDQQKGTVTKNILLVEMIVDQLLEDVVDHLGHTHNNCIRSCIGTDATESLLKLDIRQLAMILTLTLRRLAELRFDQKG